MRELRVQHRGRPYRVLYAFDPRRVAILLIGGDKTGHDRWYEELVPLADRLYDRHIEILKQEGFDLMAKKFSNLVAKMPPERRARARERAQETLTEMALRELRRARELSQAQLAEALGEKQPNISQLEQRTDMYVSTLRKYIEAMGGELDIIARFPEGAVRIRQFQELDAEK